MSTIVNMHRAKTELSKLVAKALEGEEVIVTRSGKPVVRLVPIRKPRVPGIGKGLGWIGPNFDDPMPEDWLKLFYEGPIFPAEKDE